jgi:hypothetical protein
MLFLRMKKHVHLRKKQLPRSSLRLRTMLKPKQKSKLVRKKNSKKTRSI